MTKKSRGKFRYRGDKRTVESVVRKSKQSGGMYDSYLLGDVQLLKLKEGDTTLRILPPSWPEEDDKEWGDGWDIGIWIHFGVGPDNATYLCLDKMGKGTCPICEARRDADEDERDQLKPSWRALAWVIDRSNEKAGPQVWSMPVSVFREINLRSVDKKHNTPIPIDSPSEGYDITFSREGTGIKTKYEAFEVDRDSTPLHDDEEVEDKWLDYIEEHPLPDILNFYEPGHIEKVLFGKATARAADDEEESEERAPRGDGRAARSSRRARSEADDEEDTSRSSRRARREPDDEEPDEEPDEPDEEEAAPHRTRSKSKDDDPEEESEEEGDPSKQARSRLDKLKGRRARQRPAR